MKKFISWLENSFAPKMNVVNQNVWVTTFKDSIVQIMPFVFLGSVFCVLTIPGALFELDWWPNFWTPFGWTMGMLSLLLSFLIPFNLMEKKRIRKQRLIAGMSGLILFLIITTPQVVADATVGYGHYTLGAGGMFVAMVSGVFVGLIMQAFAKFTFFKEDSVIPDFVKSWFDFMLPIGIVVVSGWVVVDLLGIDIFSIIVAVFKPLQDLLQTPFGWVLIYFTWIFVYSMGISSMVIYPLYKPVQLAAIAANVAVGAAAAGSVVSNSELFLFTGEMTTMYACIGGTGMTLSLVLLLLFCAKSKKLKSLGKASIVPGIFNINEPVVFGCIAWNPIMMVPMWIIGIVIPIVIYVFTKVIPFAPLPTLVLDMWYLPTPIYNWIITSGSIQSILLMLITFLVSGLIWYPFFRIYDKQQVELELASEKTTEK